MKFHNTSTQAPLAEDLVKKPGQTVTHLNLKAGAETGWHNVDYSVIVVPYHGKIKFSGKEESQVIQSGDFVEMEPGEEHNVTALEDSGLIVVKSHLQLSAQ